MCEMHPPSQDARDSRIRMAVVKELLVEGGLRESASNNVVRIAKHKTGPTSDKHCDNVPSGGLWATNTPIF